MLPNADVGHCGRPLMVAFALVGAIGVVAGAFGAHALKDVLDARLLEVWRTSVFYLLVHTLAGIFWESRHPGRGIGVLFLCGIGVFSGSLFALCLSGINVLGAITPVGGLAFVLGWLRAAWLESKFLRDGSGRKQRGNTSG